MLSTMKQGYRIISLEGEMNYENSRHISKELLSFITEEQHHYILDVSRLESIDSTGLGILFSFCKTCHIRKKESKLVAGNTSWYKLLHFSKLDRVLSIYPDVSTAILTCKMEPATGFSILEY
ncbi:STAS domain-containing protein [Aneurinibacillus aneurinilyticus]|jgi:anti-anti-sigma factor|uniref:Anti-sigma factor antagonist n=2 Tax=Aneurinibacillus aneurinilyticus TaxID=1391 RepID=A0A848CQZ7_ANEAE|nr:STAS domain-containing protein [Aneurinibacillus aneurinilyticus]MED0672958.1 STAS domain-containing protein [Aneurinibacillus aneurinilyticus]MED0709232.1 STAS domain-containing protein [Aneurinibacillus aneurinilyticus]MED0726213.1 STAS domain-containing protein [Aneurinibacillus aneurinilyticus]MED0734315.1 STAS domain-containing protein [Aneurinibacillus aneurinilyticus]MED0739720.1 STAS domain-containing protein [Aneurinibacillus aneurinilyticus]